MGGRLANIKDRLAFQMMRPNLIRHHDPSPPVGDGKLLVHGRESCAPSDPSVPDASRSAALATAAFAPRRRLAPGTDRTAVSCSGVGDEDCAGIAWASTSFWSS